MKVRDILRTEKDWTKGSFARDHTGFGVAILDEEACCFCLLGAIYKSCDSQISSDKIKEQVKQYIKNKFPGKYLDYKVISGFNDDPETKFEDVRAVLEELNI